MYGVCVCERERLMYMLIHGGTYAHEIYMNQMYMLTTGIGIPIEHLIDVYDSCICSLG